jgi:hypothetical protein
MTINPLYGSTIERAMKRAGGRDQLVAILKITSSNLDDWLAGRADPPHASFIAMLDLIAMGRLSTSSSGGERHDS